jgi:hypothetical protein
MQIGAPVHFIKTQASAFTAQPVFLFDLPAMDTPRPGKHHQQWKRLIERYFRTDYGRAGDPADRFENTSNRFGLQLASGWTIGVPRLLVATKSDKLSNNQLREQLRVISKSLGDQSVVMSSAKTGTGCKDIWKRVLQATAVESSENNY